MEKEKARLANESNVNLGSKIEHQSVEVRLQNLTKEFVDKSGKVTVAVNDFSVVIPAGKLIGLLGPSGCGKSTTLYMIAGLHKPTAGRIFFGDDDVTNTPPEQRGIGLVFQNYALYPHMTVRQNIMFPLENMKVPREEALARAKEMAELVHIGELMDRKPNQLSGGQQQRVAIARALVKKPKVLLLDEPLSNLDARLRLQTREEIKRIQRETGITTIFVTHDQEEAMSISDEIILMNFGEEQQKGAPQHVYDEPENLFVASFLGTPPIGLYDVELKGGKVYLDDTVIFESKKLAKEKDRKVVMGVRPEGYEPNPNGKVKLNRLFVETIGRDLSIVATHENARTESFRVIISAKNIKLGEQDVVAFDLDPNKTYIFDEEDGRRLA